MTLRVISDGVSTDAYVIGSEWRHCATKAEATRRLRTAPLGVALASGEGAVVTTLDKDFIAAHPLAGRGKYVSALAVIAAQERDAVVFHDLGNDQVWIGAVRAGAPLPDCDSITSMSEGHEALREMLRFVPGATIIGSEVDAASGVASVLQSADEKKRRDSGFRKPKSRYAPFAMAGAAALAVVLAGTALQSVHAARVAAKKAQAVAMARINEGQRIDAVIRQYNEDVRVSIESARREAALGVPVTSQLDQWLAAAAKLPAVSRGFRLERVQCDIRACMAAWRAMQKASLAGPEGDITTRDDQSVTTVQKLGELTKQTRLNEDRVEVLSRFHQLGAVPGLIFTISAPPAPLLAPMPPRPEVPQDRQGQLAAVQPVTVAYRSEVSLHVPLGLLREAVARFGDSGALQSIEIGPITSANGATTLPPIKVTGSHVQLPR
ncbi:MAG TPA: hypothetical protein VLJ57_24030 [Burkholderiaceae bacterium]|nr:hypothetical protein [Burkholderiaceae bacterium]